MSNVVSLDHFRRQKFPAAPGDEPFETCKTNRMPAEETAPCKTRAKRRKSNAIKRARVAGSRIGFSAETHSSRAPCTPIPDEDFDALLEATSVSGLRKMFPREHSAHTAMLRRAKEDKCTVHPEFRPFKSFLRHMRQCPSPERNTVDRRVNADKEYAPGKVRWASKEEQARNRDSSITLPYKGQDLPLPEVAELTGQKADTLRHRLNAGWRKEEAVAGVRMDGAALTNAGWPAGATASIWDGPYKGWATLLPNNPAATRSVFFCWITGNRIRYLQKELARRFPDYFDADMADPDADDRLLPVEDEDYQKFLLFRRLFDEAYAVVAQDGHQVRLFSDLRKHRPPILCPKEAYAAMKARRYF